MYNTWLLLSVITCFLCWHLPSYTEASTGNNIYVRDSSINGDDKDCGQKSHPCKTIRYAIEQRASKNSTILLLANNGSVPYKQCDDIASHITQDLTIEGDNNVITVDCSGSEAINNQTKFLKIDGFGRENLTVTLKKLNISGFFIAILARDVSLILEDTFFFHNKFVIVTKEEHTEKWNCTFINLSIRASIFEDNPAFETSKRDVTSAIALNHCYSNLILTDNSFFSNSYIKIHSPDYICQECYKTQTTIFSNSSFTRSIGNSQNINALLRMTCAYNYCVTDISVENCTFSNQSAIYMSQYSIEDTKISINIRNSVFQKSRSGALFFSINVASVAREHFYLNVTDCIFLNNLSQLPGGAILLSFTLQAYYPTRVPVYISNTTFTNNTSVSGAGGALHFERADVTLRNVTFLYNYAGSFGSSINMRYRGSALLQNVQVIGSPKNQNSLMGSETYFEPNVDVSMIDVNFTSTIPTYRANEKYFAIMILEGTYLLENVTINCSAGFRIFRYNTIYNKGLNPSKSLWYYCQSCPRGFYTLDSYSGVDEENLTSGTCHECPFGADCTHKPKAKPNFWGYATTSDNVTTLQMIQCLPGYCCQNNEMCTSYDSCNVNRTGTLCGRCKQGFSEALFSQRCIENEKCANKLSAFITIFVVVVAILFFLLYQGVNIANRVRRKLVLTPELVNLRSKWCSCKGKGKRRGNEETDGQIRGVSIEIEINVNTPNTAETGGNERDENVANIAETDGDDIIENTPNTAETCGNERDENVANIAENDEDEIIKNTPNTRETDGHEIGNNTPGNEETDGRDGYVDIMFFYHQIAILLTIDLNNEPGDFYLLPSSIRTSVVGIFLFRIDAFFDAFFKSACVFSNVTPMTKEIISISMVFGLYVCLGFVFIALRIARNCCNTTSLTRDLSNCTLRILTLTYTSVTHFIFRVSYCMFVGNTDVMFIDGRLPCLGWWSYIFIILYSLLFCIVLCIGPALLSSSKIIRNPRMSDEENNTRKMPLFVFYVCCFFPFILPLVFVFWLFRWQENDKDNTNNYESYQLISNNGSSSNNNGNTVRDSIILYLQGPYRKVTLSDYFKRGFLKRCSIEGLLNMRKLILVGLLTFIHDKFISYCLVTFCCTVFLVLNIKLFPYRGFACKLETVSLTLLSCFAAFNIGKAMAFSQGVVVHGLAHSAIQTFDILQSICTSVPVGVGIVICFFIIFDLITGITMRYCSCVRSRCYNGPDRNQENRSLEDIPMRDELKTTSSSHSESG